MIQIEIVKEEIGFDESILFGGFLAGKAKEKGFIKTVKASGELHEGYVEIDTIGVSPNMPVSFYKGNWNLKTNKELVDEGLVVCGVGMKFDGENIIEKTQLEKWLDGDEELPETMKFNADKTNVEAKTQKELFTDGVITEEDYSNYIKQQRDGILSSMDKYSIMYQEGVITEEQYDKVKKHKDYLRYIPQSKGFPKTFIDFEEFKF